MTLLKNGIINYSQIKNAQINIKK